ncbi:cobalamin biosynthesis protein [Amycolatopsis umgeniensis]|uniref:Cobalamin biosynthesis protein CobD n=1 Tax=Amycolatopsis umgeniensis TaxID=336628 RepID=A0A841B8P5_9PSEU|nr:CobD/CbiB family cobalamin biosynthesis protein [Amycolatopsis umgeniensis]MBB5855281.1 adenosylcobinamide-phosphate synthase [Amycolatopsis umgeniensis]
MRGATVSAARAIGLVLGVAADGAIGDPRSRPPVTAFARAASAMDAKVRSKHPAAGLLWTGGLAGSAVLAGFLAERAGRRSPVLQATTTAVTTWAVLGAAGLAAHGTSLARDLEEGDLGTARGTLSTLDPRVADDLGVIGLSRASVETLAENTADVVIAPLVWGALAGVPGLLGSRVISLLRGLGRGRPERYRWLVARLDEIVHLVPTRVAAGLTVLAAPVVGGSAGGAWRAWRRDTTAHPSPNAGRVEAAFAGALEIRVGGRTVYPHGVEELPVLGIGRNPDAGHVTRAVELSRVVGWLGAISSVVLAVLVGLRRRKR